MPKKSLADKLRISAERAALRNKEKERVKAEARKATIAKQAWEIAKEMIAELPQKLKEAARDGNSRLMVLDSGGTSHELYEAVKSLLCQYANKNGIRWEAGDYRPSDEVNYDCLYFRWDKK
ncbi:MAG: hypothetical protein G01um10143_683 [Parcubacteria group bacterium Gr01-1014_3]|nr:MAG: hypothetical protein G01um10143_683 [Parcubacteria group bacterium Gr01-1014_3]